jgi:hypothetical protein
VVMLRWIVTLVLACSLSACAGTNVPQSQGGVHVSADFGNAIARHGPALDRIVVGATALYVFNASNYKLEKTIDGTDNPFISPNGDIFAVSGSGIRIYSPKLKLIRTLLHDLERPSAIAFGAAGTAYVQDTDRVVAFPNGEQAGAYAIEGTPLAVTVGPNNYLYIHHAHDIDVYVPGQKKPIKSIYDDAPLVSTMKIDSAKNLYVAEKSQSSRYGEISVFNTSSGKLEYSITQGISYPLDMAIGPDKDLYVLDDGTENPYVSVYPLGSSKYARLISGNMYMPSRILVDPAGYVYVENWVRVAVFAPEQSLLYYTIEIPGSPQLKGIAYGR